MANIVYKDIKQKTTLKDATAGDIVRFTLNNNTLNFNYRIIVMIIDLEQAKEVIEETFCTLEEWDRDDLVGGVNLSSGELILFSKEKECEIYKGHIIINDSAF